MTEYHILLTGAGRRIELIQEFRQAALVSNTQIRLYGADMTGTAPALTYCDEVRKVCAMRDPNYIRELLKICIADHIDLIIPTIDTDLLILSQNKDSFQEIGTKVLISAPDMIQVCRDKNNTGAFFVSCGLKAPLTFNDYKAYPGPFPCFIKPKDGSSSINAFKVDNAEELSVYAEQVEDYIVQPFVAGKEYTIDIFCDFDGNPIFITPRERLQVRAGEVLKTSICMDQRMIDESKKLIEKFKPCGPLTVQLIRDERTGDDYFIEINPRFGGGAPLSMKAGARSAEALLAMLRGEKMEYRGECMSDGAIYSRFDQSVCISEGANRQPIKGVIFDLDDTLYSEKQYIRSGYQKIADHLGMPEASGRMWKYFLNGQQAIDMFLAEVGMEHKKEECLQIYRNQIPDITLYDGVPEMLRKLIKKGIKVGIITDGRPEGQRNKIAALGLDKIISDIVITDELGGVQFRKPNDISFRIMQNRWRLPFENIVYVGDNPRKDFQAPKQLGMQTIYLRNPDGLYSTPEETGIENVEEIERLIETHIE